MIYALAARLDADESLDPLAGLGALVLRGQGDEDELDHEQRELVRALIQDLAPLR
jgi:hypothetical protein